MAFPRFVHLRLHTEYSLLEGAVRLKALPDLVARAGMPAVAVTETNNMFSALEAATGLAAKGVQPIMGCQVSVMHDPWRPGEKPRRPAPVVLLAKDETGYENLLRLNTCLYMARPDLPPQVTFEELDAHGVGLICLTGGPDGAVGRPAASGQEGRAAQVLDRLHAIFGDRLYVELQRHHEHEPTERFHLEEAYRRGLPLVATNDVYFDRTEMHAAHDAFLCIAEGAYVDQDAPRRKLTAQHYLKTPAEMAALFADLPEALENSVEIARRCAVAARGRDPILPRFADDEVAELRRQAADGLAARLAVIPPAAPAEAYRKRLDYELGVIEGMGFPGYFLIVADFIKWAKAQSIPVGPGRGSGAGSLVAYALTITDLDPLRYNLLFERFLNPDRVSMPDFDIDFCMDRREEVIQYVQGRYGKDRVGQIITFGGLLSKAAVRDVGRVLGMPYGQCDQLSKMIPVEGVKPVSITRAVAEESRLREASAETEQDRREGRTNPVRRLMDFAEKLEGLLRNASTHAAGVVIGDRPLDRLVPIYKDPRSDMPATQFNMKWVEKAGLVKFDFLGLKTLTQIQNAVDLIRAQGRDLHVRADGTRIYDPAPGTRNDIAAIPLDDEGAYRLYAEARTVAVFQVESTGMMDALRRMRPTCIEDIVALVALYRPGPMENIPKYCEVKNGLRPRESIHPSIDAILDETQGIIVYQEQVMEIARKMAGYSLGGADLLRRAMGKKIQAEMDAQKPLFLDGAARNGIDAAKASEVWNLLDKFANYGFNKSHAAAYAVVSYQTAWLKANHPVEFMAGIANSDLHLTDKLAVYAEECRKTRARGGLGLEMVPPCVNRSEARFVVRDGKLVYALGALKNVGVEAMELLVRGRGETPFATLFDVARRVDLKRIGKRCLEMLACAGAFDQLDANRARVLAGLDALVRYSADIHYPRPGADGDLLGGIEAADEPLLPQAEDWLPAERLAQEFAAVGFYLSGHPLDDYMAALRRKDVRTLAEVQEMTVRGPAVAKIAGVVAARQERKSARGNRFAFVQCSDPTGAYEAMVFSDTLDAHRADLEPGSKVILQVEATQEADQMKLLARSVSPVDDAVAKDAAAGLRVFLERADDLSALTGLLERLKSEASRARGPMHLCLLGEDLPGEVELALPGLWPVSPAVKGALRSLPGVATVEEV